MEILCALSVFLLVIMVLGHGMWVVVAWFFRAISGANQSAAKPCLHCGRYGMQHGRCVICGAVQQPTTPQSAAARDDLRTTIFHLHLLADRGLLDRTECARLVALLTAELRPTAAPQAPQLPTFTPVVPPSSAPVSATLRETPSQPAPLAPTTPTLPPPLSAPLAPVPAVLVPAVPQPARPAPLAPVEVVNAALVHPLDRPVTPAPPVPPRQPGRPLADVLQSFMEESNIRWGEILAATLVVLCSVGLVISLRSTLKEIPYFPAILFTLFTVSFHGAGLYTLRRWNLQAVSRVILIISLLLVPLSFAGAIALQPARPASLPLFLLAVSIGAVVFTWVAYTASRAVIGPFAWPVTIGVVGPSLAQVLVKHVDFPAADLWRINLVFELPLVCFLIAVGWHVARLAKRQRLAQRHVVELLSVLGICGFSLLALLVVLLLAAGPRLETLARLSPNLSLAAAGALGVGLLIQRRTTARSLALWQTAGTAISVLFALAMLALVVVAWPKPQFLLAVGAINGVLLIALGIWGRAPLLYAPGIACTSLALTIAIHLFGGQFADRDRLPLKLLEAALMGRTGVTLAILGGVVALLAHRRALPLQPLQHQYSEARVLAVSSGAMALFALGITLFSGFVPIPAWKQDAPLAAGTLLVLAAGLVAAAPFARRAELAICGSFIGWLALIQALVLNTVIRTWLAELGWLPTRPLLVATLAHGLLASVLALIASWRHLFVTSQAFSTQRASTRFLSLVEPLATTAVVSLTAIIPFVLWVRDADFRGSVVLAVVAAAAWILLTLATRWPGAVSGLQVMAAAAAAVFIAGRWYDPHSTLDWFTRYPHLFSQVIAIAAGLLIWSLLRRIAVRLPAVHGVLQTPWPAVDQLWFGAATLAFPLMTFALAAPHVAWELGIGQPASPALVSLLGVRLLYGWIALAAILLALLGSLWERVTLPALIGLGIASFSAVWLVATHGQGLVAAASAARWAAAGYALLWAAIFIARDPLFAFFKHSRALRWSRLPAESRLWFCAQPLLFGGFTSIALTVLAVQQQAAGAAVKSPLAGSLFAWIGPTASYALPLIAIVAVLLSYAIRERQAGFALVGAAVWQLAANLAYLLHVDATWTDTAKTITFLHWNAIAAGSFALVWQSLERWITSPAASDRQQKLAGAFWLVPVTLALAAVSILVAWAGLAIVTSPTAPPAELGLLGSLQSYLAIGLLLAAIVWRVGFKLAGDAACWLAAAAVPLIAATIHQFDAGGQWFAFHTLETGWLGLAAVATGIFWLARRSDTIPSETDHSAPLTSSWAPHHRAAAALATLTVVLAIRAVKLDPAQPWWSAATVLGAAMISATLGLLVRSQLYAYGATLFAALVAALFWIAPATDPYFRLIFEKPPYTWLAGFETISLAFIATASFWLHREILAQSRWQQPFGIHTLLPPIHKSVALLVLPVYCLFRLLFTLFADAPLIPAYEALSLVTMLAAIALLFASLWDRRATYVWPVGYLCLAATWCLLIGLGRSFLPDDRQTFAALLLAAGAHVAVTSHLWSYGANLAAWGDKHGIFDPIAGLVRIERWLPALNIVTTAAIALLCFLPVITFPELDQRVAIAWAPAVAAWGMVCLAQNRRREPMQLASLLLAGLSAVYLAWAQLDPGAPAVWMTRIFRLFMVLGTLTLAYGLLVPRFLLTSGDWHATSRKAGHLAGAAALLAFLGTLALELDLFLHARQAAIASPQVAAIAVVILGLIAGLISLAVLPGSDPLVLSERGRQIYVYAAQACAALLFAHLYICRPEWFGGVLQQYWPFIIMAIAFAGLGAAEIFERRNIRVLAEPLRRTGALLPLLPVIGWWVASPQVNYSLLLLVTGILYLALSYTRKSWAAMIAATMAANGALWALWSDSSLAFVANPQLWLIPPALSVLIAAHVNRHRLSSAALAAIRYAASIVIYLSSTSEIFTRAFAAGIWPPMILLGLAVAGAFLGIALRVRAFLWLGTIFTLIALIAMVRHAAQSIGHVWPWWLFGIALGVGILVLFGVFEKKRAEIGLLITRLRQWEQ